MPRSAEPASVSLIAVDRGRRTSTASVRPSAPPVWLAAVPLGIVVALLPAYLTASVFVGVALVGALLARPRWALYALAFSVPYQGLAEVRIQTANVTATEAVFLLLLVGWGTARAAGRLPAPELGPLPVAIGLLLSLLVLSCAVAPNLVMSLKELVKWGEIAGVTLIGQSLIRTSNDRRDLFAVMTVAVVSQGIYGLLQSLLLWGPNHFMIGTWLMRAYGSFEQPNPFGGYLGLHLPLILSVALFGVQRRESRVVTTIAASIVGACLLTSMSRGAWLGQVVGVLTVILTESRSARHAVMTFGGLGVVMVLAAWPVLPTELTNRILSIFGSVFAMTGSGGLTPENWAVMERVSQWTAGWRMFSANPLVGVGIGNYNSVYREYALPEWPIALGHAHNHYLTIAAEAGLFACLAYIGVILTALRSTLRTLRAASGRFDRAIALGALGSIAALATHNLVDVLFVHGMSVTIGLLLALASAGTSDRTSHRSTRVEPVADVL